MLEYKKQILRILSIKKICWFLYIHCDNKKCVTLVDTNPNVPQKRMCDNIYMHIATVLNHHRRMAALLRKHAHSATVCTTTYDKLRDKDYSFSATLIGTNTNQPLLQYKQPALVNQYGSQDADLIFLPTLYE